VADAELHFPLDGRAGGAPARLVYRPWSTRTLRLRVTSAAGAPALRLQPGRMAAAASGLVQAAADDSPDFVVSWGGGHEPGPCLQSEDLLKVVERCVELPPGASSTLFFNVRHQGPALPASTLLTLRAVDPDRAAVHAELALRLEAPPDWPEDVVRMTSDGRGTWRPSDGAHLARYDPRWWPDEEVACVPGEAPPLSIRRSGQALEVTWGDAPQPVARIEDHTSPSVLDQGDALSFELFAFPGGLVVLRAWFFWLDRRLGPALLVAGRHEVPDVERFDFLLRPADGRVLLAGTDAHWREVWGEVPEAPAPAPRATLGLGGVDKLELLKGVLHSAAGQGPALANGRYDPLPYVVKLAQVRAQPPPPGQPPRATGSEAHVPSLHHTVQDRPGRMTSSDVRLG
jgi:hypothetical protein